jgi:hypothetical protein
MEGNLVLAPLDVLVIKHFFSKIINNVSLELLCKEDPPFWDVEKWDTNESIQKTD